MATLDTYNICFLGRTGNGKSSLINAITGSTFPTDPTKPCTKDMYSVTILDDGNDAYTIYDTPGIGEFETNDPYFKFYEHAVSIADCIVLVTTFDRTDAPAMRLLMSLKEFIKDRTATKFVIAFNHIDSKIVAQSKDYQPWDSDNNKPSLECEKKIQIRIKDITDNFKDLFLPFTVVPVCALRKFGIKEIKSIILNK